MLVLVRKTDSISRSNIQISEARHRSEHIDDADRGGFADARTTVGPIS